MKKHLNVKARLLLLLLLISGNVLAQNNSEEAIVAPIETRYTLAIDPTYLSNYGLKFDFEKRLNQKQWLQVGIAGYYAEESDTKYLLRYDSENVYGIKGGGLSIGLKEYITKDKNWKIQAPIVNRWYFQPTFTYNYLHVKHLHSAWEQTVEDGLTYHAFKPQMHYKSYHQLNANLLFGLQSTFNRILFYDAYIGLGYRHTIHKKEEDASSFENNNGMYSLGYSGVYFTLGVRFGFEFGRK